MAQPRKRPPALTDRLSERRALDRLVGAVRAGESRSLVVRGDPGVGKSVLLDHLIARASGAGCQVVRAVGVESEMELAFAGLHQLCAPMMEHLDSIPVPQHDALRTAFGMAAGPAPDRFFVGLAVLSLLSEVAAERPLVCVADDVHWLDRASVQALGFAARRLGADPVAMVFAARESGAELAGLPELEIGGLGDSDARAANTIATGSAPSRRAANPSACTDARSSHCTSSITQTSGRSLATSDSKLSTARPTKKRSGGGPAAMPNAVRSASCCGPGMLPAWSSIGTHS